MIDPQQQKLRLDQAFLDIEDLRVRVKQLEARAEKAEAELAERIKIDLRINGALEERCEKAEAERDQWREATATQRRMRDEVRAERDEARADLEQ